MLLVLPGAGASSRCLNELSISAEKVLLPSQISKSFESRGLHVSVSFLSSGGHHGHLTFCSSGIVFVISSRSAGMCAVSFCMAVALFRP